MCFWLRFFIAGLLHFKRVLLRWSSGCVPRNDESKRYHRKRIWLVYLFTKCCNSDSILWLDFATPRNDRTFLPSAHGVIAARTFYERCIDSLAVRLLIKFSFLHFHLSYLENFISSMAKIVSFTFFLSSLLPLFFLRKQSILHRLSTWYFSLRRW